LYFVKNQRLVIGLVVVESCDEILNLVFIFENVVLQVPVVHDKPQMITYLNLFGYSNSAVEGVSHDSNKHVQKMECHNERCNKE
jgi:hypothetical protein